MMLARLKALHVTLPRKLPWLPHLEAKVPYWVGTSPPLDLSDLICFFLAHYDPDLLALVLFVYARRVYASRLLQLLLLLLDNLFPSSLPYLLRFFARGHLCVRLLWL